MKNIIKYVEVKTQSNFRGLNGKLLRVAENHGNFFACWFFNKETGSMQKADFGKSEIVAMYESLTGVPPFLY